MVNSVVQRATSDMLIGPDWAMNIEICDMLNRDPTQSKDVVKGIKKRIGSKNPKVQLLALTLLETIVKNCGDLIHMQVAEKDLPRDMVRIVKKKPDFRVKEKILILIDTWQEAFGGARARYTQFYSAYQELLHVGAVFPQRTESSAPVFTPPQTQPLTSYPQHLRTPGQREEDPEASTEAEFPTLSLSEIQNARGIMDVLAEMLNALDPGNKEGLRQDVITDLVEQCRTYKQRVVHLANSTTDESLLCQGLALNDELQRLLARHESLVSGTPSQKERSQPEPTKALVDVDSPLIDTGESTVSDKGTSSNTVTGADLQLAVISTAPTQVDSKFDLLSGGDFNSPSGENALAIVSTGETQTPSPVANQQNALALVDMFSQSNGNLPASPLGQAYSTSQYEQQPPQQQNFQSPQPPVFPNEAGPNMMLPQYQQPQFAQGASPAWNGQMSSHQQPALPAYGAESSSSSLPPPPWEAQPTENDHQLEGNQYHHHQPLQNGTNQESHPNMNNYQAAGMYSQQAIPNGMNQESSHTNMNYQPAGMYTQPITNGHLSPQVLGQHPQQSMGLYPAAQLQPGQQIGYYPQQQVYGNQMAGYGYGYGHQQQNNPQFLDQRMSGLSVGGDNGAFGRSQKPSYVPPSGKPSKPEDKLFGDLVDISKFKPK